MTEVLIASFTSGGDTIDSQIWKIHPASVQTSAIYQTFMSPSNYIVTRVQFRMRKMGNPIGFIHVGVYAHTGTFGTNGKPTGSALVYSDLMDVSTLPTSNTYVDFNFTDKFIIQRNTPYCISVEIYSGTYTGDVDVPRIIGNSGSGYGGNRGVYNTGAWSNFSADFYFNIYGDPAISELIDEIQIKYDIPKTYDIDTMVQKLDITKEDLIDLVIKTQVSKISDVDILIDEFQLKGRMNACKESLINKISAFDSSLTVIDAWRMQTYNFSSFRGSLVSIKIMPSRMARLHFGSQITNQYFGQCYVYRFTLHVLSRYAEFDFAPTHPHSNEPIHAVTAMNIANGIVKYLRQHNTDTDKGVLSIIDITARESDPAGLTRGGAHMARIIVEGAVLCERPYKKRESMP